MLWECTPATMAMLVNVLDQELVLFRTPSTSFNSILITTWCSSHLHHLLHSHTKQVQTWTSIRKKNTLDLINL